MYLDFFNLKEFPFAITCDAKFFYESAVHREALANMLYTIQQQKGMVLVSGEVGAGKTFLINMLAERLGAGCTTVVMKNPPQSGRQMARALASRVGLTVQSTSDKLQILEGVEEHLVRLGQRGRLVALVIDESQDLTPGALEELRLLWNWECDGRRLLQIVLVGQPELRQRLMEPKWEPLRQRIVLSYHLNRLTSEDVAGYVRHRLTIASDGRCLAEFTPEALAEVHAATDGIPRMINVLCDNALLVAYARGTFTVDRAMVGDVLRDMTCWGLRAPELPNRPEVSPHKLG